MKFETSKKELIDVLEDFINLLPVRSKRQEIILPLQKRVSMRTMTALFNNNTSFLLIPDESTLYYILKEFEAWHRNNEEKLSKLSIDKKLLSPSRYFTKFEIEEYDSQIENEPKQTPDTFTFKNVTQVTSQMWNTPSITAQEIQKLFESTLLRYDFSMQRESEKKKSKFTEQYYENIKVYENSKKRIEEKMLKGDYTPTTISINILQSDNPIHYSYDEEEATFTISKKDRNSLIDGMHRCSALLEALVKNKNLNQKMKLNIFTYSLAQARDFIFQEGQKNPIPKGILKGFDSSDPHVKFINELINMGSIDENLLINRVGVEKDDVNKINMLTTVEVLAIALEDNFQSNISDFTQKRNLSIYLRNFFNELLSTFSKDLDDVDLCRKDKVHLHQNMFYAYMKIASMLQNEEDWHPRLLKVLKSLDFNKEAWVKLGMKNFEIQKKQKAKLYSYIEDAVNDTK